MEERERRTQDLLGSYSDVIALCETAGEDDDEEEGEEEEYD